MRKTLRPNIAFAGLTAAGKTTHAKILAEQLGYECLSATKILLDILGDKENPDKVWFTSYERIQKAREDDRIDQELEQRVRELANNRDGLILDTWAMAYIYEGPLIRLWIESDEGSRARKCYVSQGPTKNLDLRECQQLLHKKDTTVRGQFIRRLRFDLFTDWSRYDAIIDNTDLIPEPTDQCSQFGIATFEPVVHDVVRYLINHVDAPGSSESIQSLQETYGKMILKVNMKPWSFS